MTRRQATWLWAAGFVGLLATGVLLPHPVSEAGARQAIRLGTRQAARIELGRRLFFDPAASQTGEVSCASCHDPKHGFSDPGQFSADEDGQTLRHSQPLIDAKFNPTAHRDGEFDSIEALVVARLGGKRDLSKHGTTAPASYNGKPMTPSRTLRTKEDTPTTPVALRPDMRDLEKAAKKAPRFRVVARRLEDMERYDEAFRAAFGARAITLPKIARALADYIRTIESTEAPIDRFLAGDATAIDRPALRGLALFRGRAGCAQCHSMDVHRKVGKPLFTDFEFHNTGTAIRFGTGTRTNPFLRQAPSATAARRMATKGRLLVTNQPDDKRAFKTPTLRDVARRPPYMQDGSMRSLEEIVVYYAAGCNGANGLDKRIKKFDASEDDIADLVAFLHSLSGDEQPGAATEVWTRRAKTTRIAFRTGSKPVVGMTVVLEGVGDALPVSDAKDRRIELTTDARGEVRYEPGEFTHVRIVEPQPRKGHPWGWIPDTCHSVEVDLVSTVPTEILLQVDKETEPPERIVAERDDETGLILFNLLPLRSKAGWRTYRAWIPNRDVQASILGPFLRINESVKKGQALLEILAGQRSLPHVLRPNGSHELRLLDFKKAMLEESR